MDCTYTTPDSPTRAADSDSEERGRNSIESIEALLQSFQAHGMPGWDVFRRYYADDLVFQDPLIQIRGLAPFYKLQSRIAAQAEEFRAAFGPVAQRGNVIYHSWTLYLKPARFLPRFEVEGQTELHLDGDGKIVYHREYWDLVTALLRPCAPLFRFHRRLLSALIGNS